MLIYRLHHFSVSYDDLLAIEGFLQDMHVFLCGPLQAGRFGLWPGAPVAPLEQAAWMYMPPSRHADCA